MPVMEELEDQVVEIETEDERPKHSPPATPLREKKEKFREVLGEQRNKINTLKEEVDEKEKEVEKLKADKLTGDKAASDLAKKLQAEIKNLKNGIHDGEVALSESKAKERDATSQYTETLNECGRLKAANTDLLNKILAAETEISNLRKQNTGDPPEVVEKMKKKLEEKTCDLQNLEKFHSDTAAELNKLKKENTVLQNQCRENKEKLQQEITEARKGNMTLKATKKELESANQLIEVLRKSANQPAQNEESAHEKKPPKENRQELYEKICLFELKEKGLCSKQGRCKFEHTFDNNFRSNEGFLKEVIKLRSEKMNFCAIELVSKGECDPEECSFNHNIQTSVFWKERRKDNPIIERTIKSICFHEFSGKGSCPHGSRCHFDHKFPETLRNDPKVREEIDAEKERKRPLCINEYNKKGSCRKKNMCKFSHIITQEQLENKALQEKMREKFSVLTGKAPVPRKEIKSDNNALMQVLNRIDTLQNEVLQLKSQVQQQYP